MLSGAAALAMPAIVRAEPETEISFYFPVAVGGPITKIIDGYAADFQRENPGIKVTPIYAGTYQDTLTKAQTALKAGSGPQMAVLLSTDVFSLMDDDLIVPIDSAGDTAGDAADAAWLKRFYPAFLKNGEIGGHIWGVPFQRSTIVLFRNKGCVPLSGPGSRPVARDAWRGTRRDCGEINRNQRRLQTTRWGTQIPGAPASPIGCSRRWSPKRAASPANASGNKADYASAACVEALRYWIELNVKYHAHPPGIAEWGTTPHDFPRMQKAAMIWTTTGNLSNIRANRREVRLRRGDAARRQATRQSNPAAAIFICSNPRPEPGNGAPACACCDGSAARNERRCWGIDTGWRRDPA